jgi:hypothetical protein
MIKKVYLKFIFNEFIWDQNHIRMNITETNGIDDLKTSIKIEQN